MVILETIEKQRVMIGLLTRNIFYYHESLKQSDYFLTKQIVRYKHMFVKSGIFIKI